MRNSEKIQCRFCNYWKCPDKLSSGGFCTVCQGLSEEIETLGLLRGIEGLEPAYHDLLGAVTRVIVTSAMGP